MDVITYTQARKNFTNVMNRVCEDRVPIIITRQSQKPVVMMSLEDYNAITQCQPELIEETLYLLRSPKNAQRLYKALDELKQGKYEQYELIESQSSQPISGRLRGQFTVSDDFYQPDEELIKLFEGKES